MKYAISNPDHSSSIRSLAPIISSIVKYSEVSFIHFTAEDPVGAKRKRKQIRKDYAVLRGAPAKKFGRPQLNTTGRMRTPSLSEHTVTKLFFAILILT